MTRNVDKAKNSIDAEFSVTVEDATGGVTQFEAENNMNAATESTTNGDVQSRRTAVHGVARPSHLEGQHSCMQQMHDTQQR